MKEGRKVEWRICWLFLIGVGEARLALPRKVFVVGELWEMDVGRIAL